MTTMETTTHASYQPPRKSRRVLRGVLIAAAGLTLFGVGTAVGSAGTGAPAAPAAVQTRTVTATQTVTALAPAAQAPSTANGEFGPGIYEIGTGEGQIPPGKYKTTGPTGGASGVYFALKREEEDQYGSDIVDNDLSEGPMVVTVPKSGADYVEISGGTFTKAAG